MDKVHGATVGVVGLGSMGLGMAQTLANKGFRVLGFDLARERQALAAGFGAETPDRLQDLFLAAEFLVFSLPNAQAVESVVTEHAGLLQAKPDRRVIIIDTSTSEPDVSRALAGQLGAAGHGFLDAPVSGGPSGAASGQLAMMIGGSEEDVALARPVIEAMASKIFHVGPSGAGNVAKLVNNMLVAAHFITTREGLKLAASAGVNPEAALRVVNAATGRSAVSENHFPTWVMSERFDSGFTMGLMRKDVRLACELADRTGIQLPLAELVKAMWSSSDDGLSDGEDFTRMGTFTETHIEEDRKVASNG